MNLTYEEIVELLKKYLTDEQINRKVEAKLEELSGLISREGAACIIAHELGVDINTRRLKIARLTKGVNTGEVIGKVLRINDAREFVRDGNIGRLRGFLIGDETGVIRVVAWGDMVDNITMGVGESVKIENVYVRENNGLKEIHLNERSRITKSDEVININKRKHIGEVAEGFDVEIYGTIVQLFEPRFYEICSKCSKRAQMEGENFICKEHGIVDIEKVPVINFYLDDGTGNIRVVCFRKEAEAVLNNYSAGEQIVVHGRIANNNFFNRLELIANHIETLEPARVIEELERE